MELWEEGTDALLSPRFGDDRSIAQSFQDWELDVPHGMPRDHPQFPYRPNLRAGRSPARYSRPFLRT